MKWFAVKKLSDGNGIIVDDLRNQQIKGLAYRGRTLVANNIVHDNGGGGVQIYSSDRVDELHNTAVNNSLTPGLNYGEVLAHRSADVRLLNNIAAPGGTSNRLNDDSRNERVVYDHNVYFTRKPPKVLGPSDRLADPGFVDLARRDLRLQRHSPVAGTALPLKEVTTDFHGRPRGSRPSPGALQP